MEASEGLYIGAGERAGTYQLTASAQGYEDLNQSDIVITADACHVIPVAMTLEMTPKP